MSLIKNSTQVFLHAVGEHGSFLYAIYKVIIWSFFYIKCNIRNTVDQQYISQMSAIDVYDLVKHFTHI